MWGDGAGGAGTVSVLGALLGGALPGQGWVGGKMGCFHQARVPAWVRAGRAERWHRQDKVGGAPDHGVPPGGPVRNHAGHWGQNQGFCWALLGLRSSPTADTAVPVPASHLGTPFPCNLLPSLLGPPSLENKRVWNRMVTDAATLEQPPVSPRCFAGVQGSPS